MDKKECSKLGIIPKYNQKNYYGVLSKASLDTDKPLVYLVRKEDIDNCIIEDNFDRLLDDDKQVNVYYSKQEGLVISDPESLIPAPPFFTKKDLILITT